MIAHLDQLGQPIQVGDQVAFTWSASRSIRVGTVTRLTPKRIRLTYNISYEHQGQKVFFTGNTVTRPGDCIILNDHLQQHLTMATLQKKI